MGNAMYHNWDSTERTLYRMELKSSTAASIAFGTILTHYGVSEWIWYSKMNKRRHRSPTWIVSLVMFKVLWSLLYDEMMSTPGKDKTWYCIINATIGLGGFLVNLVFTWLCDRVQNRNCSNCVEEVKAIPTHPTHPTNDMEALIPSTMPCPAKANVTVDYINNIKIFLTNLVIIYHCAGWIDKTMPQLRHMTKHPNHWAPVTLYFFRHICGSFFLSLFFFYSGYFVPISFDKKGHYDFLCGRVRRLGIPFVVYSFFLGPYVQFGVQNIFFGTPFPCGSSFFDGPTWFLNQLMIFSIIYAFACGKGWNPKMPCPSLMGFFAICLVIGLLSGFTEIFFPPNDRFCGVPQFWANFFSYPVSFLGGAIAQRNGWMEKIKEKSRIAIYVWAVSSVPLYISLKHHDKSLPRAVFWLARGVIWKGLMSMGMSLAVTVFFMDYANRKYCYSTQFFLKAMYTAYIIQHILQLVGMNYALSILDATGNVEYHRGGAKLEIFIKDDNMMLPCFLLVSTITLVILWPTAYAIRSIPGFSQVL